MNSLPIEVITYDILTRVPLDALGKCRVTCKEWNEQTQRSDFKESRQEKVQDFQGYILQNGHGCYNNKVEFISSEDDTSHGELLFNFMPKKGIIEIMDQGIAYFRPDNYYLRSVSKHYICKPTTRQWREIPKPRGSTSCLALKVLKAHPLHFKLLHLINISPIFAKPYPKQYQNYRRVEIFDSDTWTWEKAKKVRILHFESFETTTPVFVKGTFYWVTTQERIFSYHLERKVGKFIRLPEPILKNRWDYRSFSLMKYHGQLAIGARTEDEDMYIWVHENDWTLECIRDAGFMGHPFLANFCTSDLIVTCSSEDLFFHDMLRNTTTMVGRTVNWGYANIFPFVTDDVPVDLLDEGEDQ